MDKLKNRHGSNLPPAGLRNVAAVRTQARGPEDSFVGWVRKLPSGRHQASYLGSDGRRHVAPQTFDSATSADRWLVQVETAILRHEWFDPERAKVQLRDYAEAWIEQRPGLRPSTRTLYRRLLDRYVSPTIGGADLGAIDTPMVRKWRSDLLQAGVSESMAAKAYRTAARGSDHRHDGGQDDLT